MAYLESDRRRSAQELAAPRLSQRIRPSRVPAQVWLPLTLIGAALALWEWGARSGAITPLFFPAPSTIARTTLTMLGDGALVTHTSATLSRLLLGVILGGLPGVVLGLLMGWSSRLRGIVDPFIAAAHAVPKIAILPLIMIFFGVGEPSKVAITMMGAFFPMLISTMAGARLINPIHFEVAANYGASGLQTFTRVLLPGSLPLMLSGLRLALNATLLLTIAVEMISGRSGLGTMIWRAWETMRTEELYTSLLVITSLGIGFNLLLHRLSIHFIPWQAEREE